MVKASDVPAPSEGSTGVGNPVQRDGANSFETARDRTLYWTLSIYVDAQTVARRCSPSPVNVSRLKPLTRDTFSAVQRADLRSVALRDAIEPLFNDIADRERFGATADFLLAAGQGDPSSTSLEDAAAAIRKPQVLDFLMPTTFSWTTEGHKFTCRLGDGEHLPREVKLRRFWFAHSNGALSYHLAFSHDYGQYLSGQKLKGQNLDGETIAARIAGEPLESYYFLSLLQKLAAPKEFSLAHDAWDKTVFDSDLKIDPLDKLKVRGSRGLVGGTDSQDESFWLFVKATLAADAEVLFGALVKELGNAHGDTGEDLLKSLVELIEVPGLKVPRSRSLFHIHDEQFFNRLLPLDPHTKEPVARKKMVQDGCYQPYRDELEALRKLGTEVHIGAPSKTQPNAQCLSVEWLTTRNDYQDALQLFSDPPMFAHDRSGGNPIEDLGALKIAVRSGSCWMLRSPTDPFEPWKPRQLEIPAFDDGRRDCLDYLFLSGFNQNIIDWLNQDTSEILDSTDPIYPTDDEQADERFFVRYANHRAMITYVPRSRSLEIGNDYIGTCPYAFLIHVLALHNEFIAREHELYADHQITAISDRLTQLSPRRADNTTGSEEERAAARDQETRNFEDLETDINDLKSANYDDFEKHRYQNVFRYDTERKVFASLEELRGMVRRTAALRGAIQTLEDKSRDVEQRRMRQHEESQREREKETEQRQAVLSNWLGVIGASSAVGLVFTVGDFLRDREFGWGPNIEVESWGGYLFGNAALFLVVVGLPVFAYFWHRVGPK